MGEFRRFKAHRNLLRAIAVRLPPVALLAFGHYGRLFVRFRSLHVKIVSVAELCKCLHISSLCLNFLANGNGLVHGGGRPPVSMILLEELRSAGKNESIALAASRTESSRHILNLKLNQL